MVIGQRQDVGARFAGVIGMPALQGGVFRVGQRVLFAIGLVRGSDHDLRIGAAAAGSLQQAPGSLDVRLKRPQRAAVRGADDRLCSQVDDGPNLVFCEDPLQQGLILYATVDSVDPGSQPQRTSSEPATWSRTKPTT